MDDGHGRWIEKGFTSAGSLAACSGTHPTENRQAIMSVRQLKARLANSVFAFRGYNSTNLGRSRELLEHPRYGPIVHTYLREASQTCREVTGRKSDLINRVRNQRETTLKTYPEAISLIIAMELAQLRLLEDFFDIPYKSAKLCYGYSLGEVAALVASGVIEIREALKVPLRLAADCVKLAEDVTLGVLFSRGPEVSFDEVQRQCLLINQEGEGVIGVSTFLAPNSVLVMGQGDTLDRFKLRMDEVSDDRIYLRKNRFRWPPIHTPIVWQRNIPNRAAQEMHTLPGGLTAPTPPVISLVTGRASYTDINAREHLYQWTDHPQRLWDAVYETLSQGIDTVIHVGPQPNIIPATFKRLHDNVEAQTQGSIGMRALSAVVSRPWLQALLPERTALLRAPKIEQVILEDWLLEHEPSE